jgi:uncharacterized protein YjbI with pentapeptide repeats
MDLRSADLRRAYVSYANLSQSDLSFATLVEANLVKTNLAKAILIGADLSEAICVGTDISGADITGCTIYGISAWDLIKTDTVQADLRITPTSGGPAVTVDNLEMAQFIYLMLHNDNITNIIKTLNETIVLILGRFTPERKAVLEALRNALRQHKPPYVPVIFDFKSFKDHRFTETVTLLARMARFIIADLTDPASIPQELQAIVPHVHIPVQPIIAASNKPYAMFADFQDFPWMLDVYHYTDLNTLLAAIEDKIIAPAEDKVYELRVLRFLDVEDES